MKDRRQIMKTGRKFKSKTCILFLVKWLFLAILVVFTLYPVVYTILGSFKTNMELTAGGHFLPEQWHFENYRTAFV